MNTYSVCLLRNGLVPVGILSLTLFCTACSPTHLLASMFVEVKFGHAEGKKPWIVLVNPQVATCALLAYIRRACRATTTTNTRAECEDIMQEISDATEKWVALQQQEASRHAEEGESNGTVGWVTVFRQGFPSSSHVLCLYPCNLSGSPGAEEVTKAEGGLPIILTSGSWQVWC